MQSKQSTRKELIDFMMQSISDAINDPFTKMFRLGAIWMEMPIKTSTESKRRITENDLILIENGKLSDCNGLPTHKIVQLHGTAANTQFTITVENLSTNELSIIKL